MHDGLVTLGPSILLSFPLPAAEPQSRVLKQKTSGMGPRENPKCGDRVEVQVAGWERTSWAVVCLSPELLAYSDSSLHLVHWRQGGSVEEAMYEVMMQLLVRITKNLVNQTQEDRLSTSPDLREKYHGVLQPSQNPGSPCMSRNQASRGEEKALEGEVLQEGVQGKGAGKKGKVQT